MKHPLLILFVLFMAGNCQSQNKVVTNKVSDSSHYVSGKIINAVTKQELMYCTVLLVIDTTVITITQADTDGMYKIFIPDSFINKEISIKAGYGGDGWIAVKKEVVANKFPLVIDFQLKGATGF